VRRHAALEWSWKAAIVYFESYEHESRIREMANADSEQHWAS